MSLLYRHKGSLAVVYDDDEQSLEIKALKENIATMEKERSKKDVALQSKNSKFIERDRVRQEKFLEEFKTAEELEAIDAAERVTNLQLELDECQVREDEYRSTIEEEKLLEYKIIGYLHSMEIIRQTVSLVTRDVEQRENKHKLKEQEGERWLVQCIHVRKSLTHEAVEARKIIEKAEAAARKGVVANVKTSVKDASRRYEERIQAEERRREEERAERLRRLDEAQQAEVDEAERELEEKMARLNAKFSSISDVNNK